MDPRVTFQPSGSIVLVPPGSSLLDAARSAGLPLAGACRGDGLCGRCGVRVSSAGELPPESQRETRAKRRNRVAPELRLACQLTPTCDVEVTAAYW
jgi:adenylate cyclase